MADEFYTLTGVRIATPTGKAVRVSRAIDAVRNEEWWFPLSQVKERHHTEGRIVVTAWIAKKKGLI